MDKQDKPIKEEDLLENLGKIAYALDKAYISHLETDYGVVAFDEEYNSLESDKSQSDDTSESNDGSAVEETGRLTYAANIRAIKVESLTYDSEENELDCLKNVLATFSDSENTIALVINRTPEKAEMFFVIKNDIVGGNEQSADNVRLLQQSLEGNLPGSKFAELKGAKEIKENINFQNATAISLLCSVPSEKSKEFTSQRIEKLLNGIIPTTKEESYTVLILAESLSKQNIKDLLTSYEEIATAIKPFEEHQFQLGTNQTDTTGEMEQLTRTRGTADSKISMKNVNVGANGGISKSVVATAAEAVTDAGKKTAATGVGTAIGTAAGAVLGTVVPALGNILGASVGAIVGGALGTGIGAIASIFVGKKTKTNSIANSSGRNLGMSAGFGYSWGRSFTEQQSLAKTTGINHSLSLGTSESTTYTYKSYMISNMLNKVEETVKRINESQSGGLWKCAAYVLTEDAITGKNIANFLRSLEEGEKSHIEPSVIQSWIYEESNGLTAFGEIKKYLTYFTHPVFINYQDGVMVNAVSNISTDELSKAMALPKSSVLGIPVISHARFGRNVVRTDGKGVKNGLALGVLYHMGRPEANDLDSAAEGLKVMLDIDNLASHTFITGSTGSGKSNTVYKILSELRKDAKRTFMVIEPAKGEYKKIFGGCNDVTVYGTNREYTQLLQINPFSFPKGIHVLEHMDRLVEIFNVCWPMYAAMPAILKKSIENAYEDVGWNLETSKNPLGNDIFPTFNDVKNQIYKVLNNSDYSEDNKGDYIGSLVTRVDSLTTGFYRLIFANKSIEEEQLFDKNVIIDISRIGSADTKALIMGILVMKLQEYRMQQADEKASQESETKLKHITVLEEAHNILRRTSKEQVTESANLLGKAVEMLSNAVAEMRSYGEGFIIADQSPGLMDMSVIRNTNTKIVLRLPDYSDRELVGKAMGLNDEQIIELSKLETGVAAVYQNDWQETVLCNVEKFDKDDAAPLNFKYNPKKNDDLFERYFKRIFGLSNKKNNSVKENQEEKEVLRDWINNLREMKQTQRRLQSVLEGFELSKEAQAETAYNIFKGRKVNEILHQEPDAEEGMKKIQEFLKSYPGVNDNELAERIRQLIMYIIYQADNKSEIIEKYHILDVERSTII